MAPITQEFQLIGRIEGFEDIPWRRSVPSVGVGAQWTAVAPVREKDGSLKGSAALEAIQRFASLESGVPDTFSLALSLELLEKAPPG